MDAIKYIFPCGKTAQREQGSLWVLRSASGEYIDRDQYRHDLFERNAIDISNLRKFELNND